jgi:hypothetical protein
MLNGGHSKGGQGLKRAVVPEKKKKKIIEEEEELQAHESLWCSIYVSYTTLFSFLIQGSLGLLNKTCHLYLELLIYSYHKLSRFCQSKEDIQMPCYSENYCEMRMLSILP